MSKKKSKITLLVIFNENKRIANYEKKMGRKINKTGNIRVT